MCPVLKLPRLTPYMDGIGNDQTLFTQIPDAVTRDHLAHSKTPIALVRVSGPMVSAEVIQRQIARRCQVQVQWKWEAVPHGDLAFLVSFPTFEYLDRVDGILMIVPLSTAQLTFSVHRREEVPHKLEMQQVWLHVEGVPHILRSFQGLWAVGGLMGTTLDVDLFSLRKRGIVRILVEMFDTKVFLKAKDSLGHFIVSDAVVKHKVFEFRFRIEPEGYIPEPEFVPFLWRKRDDDADDDANGKHLEDAMDTSEAATATQGVGSGSSLAVQGTVTTSSSQGVQRVFAVTPFNANPVTPRGRQLLDALPLDSPLRGKGSSSAPRVSLAQLQDALHSVSIPVLRSCSASPARSRTHILGRSIPVSTPVFEEVAPSGCSRKLTQEGSADRDVHDQLQVAVVLGPTQVGLANHDEVDDCVSLVREDLGTLRDVSPLLVGQEPSVVDGGDRTQEGSGLSRSPARVSSPGDASTVAVQGSGTTFKRSARHGVDASGASATDEDSMIKAMRRKTERNLDSPGSIFFF
uniref:Uncharacterized protein n=1 Tax=Avena sativa TaxID=4498 RepID=A0ACD5YSI8_AVESA